MEKSTSYGLSTATIAAIKHVLSKHPEVERAILYGSRAMGNHREGSDIDLSLQGTAIDLSLLQKIEHELDELDLPYKMDVSVYAMLTNPEFIDHINRVGVEFYTQQPR